MDIIQAYKKTHYKTESGITLHVDSRAPELDELLSNSGLSTAIFITAWNPYSKMKSAGENKELNEQLRYDLLSLTPEDNIIQGFGQDPTGEWPGEESFLIIGISREAGIQLSKKYRQNAFIFHEYDSNTEMVLTMPEA
jgi:hypothetical protein